MAKKKISSQSPKPQRSRRKNANSGSTVLTVLIIAFITAIVGIYLLTKYSEKIPSYLIPKKISKPAMKTINLYFSDEEGLALKAEKRGIEPGTLTKEIKEAVDGLIKGPRENLIGAIPDGTRLSDVEIKDGTAFLNFSPEISERHPGGSSAEIQTVYSIVNTITLNFPEIKKVQFLIAGKKVKTIAGHIDVSFPLAPDKNYIKG